MKVIDRFRNLFKDSKSPKSFDANDAMERFMLLGAAGRDGQKPIKTFEDKSTIILSEYGPGTIFRENIYMDTYGELYHWWCGGNVKEDMLEMFWAYDQKWKVNQEVFPALREGEFRAIPKPLRVNDRYKGRDAVSFTISNVYSSGSMIDKYMQDTFCHPSLSEVVEIAREGRNTISIDIMEMGIMVKEPEKKSRTFLLGELRPGMQRV